MTKIFKLFAVSMMATSLVAAAVAQQQGGGAPAGGQNQQAPPPQGQGGGPGRGMMDPDKMVEMLTKELALTADQQTKIKDILTKQQADMKSVRDDQNTPMEEKRSKMREIREAGQKAINAVLTADQQKKYAEMQEKMRQGGGGPRPGGPGL